MIKFSGQIDLKAVSQEDSKTLQRVFNPAWTSSTHRPEPIEMTEFNSSGCYLKPIDDRMYLECNGPTSPRTRVGKCEIMKSSWYMNAQGCLANCTELRDVENKIRDGGIYRITKTNKPILVTVLLSLSDLIVQTQLKSSISLTNHTPWNTNIHSSSHLAGLVFQYAMPIYDEVEDKSAMSDPMDQIKIWQERDAIEQFGLLEMKMQVEMARDEYVSSSPSSPSSSFPLTGIFSPLGSLVSNLSLGKRKRTEHKHDSENLFESEKRRRKTEKKREKEEEESLENDEETNYINTLRKQGQKEAIPTTSDTAAFKIMAKFANTSGKNKNCLYHSQSVSALEVQGSVNAYPVDLPVCPCMFDVIQTCLGKLSGLDYKATYKEYNS